MIFVIKIRDTTQPKFLTELKSFKNLPPYKRYNFCNPRNFWEAPHTFPFICKL